MAWWYPWMGYGWGRRRKAAAVREEQPPQPPGFDDVAALAPFYPPQPLLWAVPPWAQLPSDIEREVLKARKQWLEAVKKMIEEEIKAIEERLRELGEED